MKKLLFLVLLAASLFTACSKQNNNQPKQPANTVTINGTIYSTVVIGSQTWTSVNYNGAGGENYNNGANNPVYGKLYTLAEAQSIVLPSGWRLPTLNDFNNLLAAIGDPNTNGAYLPGGGDLLALMSKTNWTTTNGNDSLGYNAEPAGLYSQVKANDQEFYGLGNIAVYISGTPIYANSLGNYCFIAGSGNAQITDLVLLATDRGSVRFVKDN